MPGGMTLRRNPSRMIRAVWRGGQLKNPNSGGLGGARLSWREKERDVSYVYLAGVGVWVVGPECG